MQMLKDINKFNTDTIQINNSICLYSICSKGIQEAEREPFNHN
jgi:hypothetical protein